MSHLLVLGALHWDVIVRAPRLPSLDETLRGQEVVYQFGGKGGNQAIAAKRAGAEVSFAGRIGADAAGASMREVLVRAGVDVTHLQSGTGMSGMSAAIVTAQGDYGAVIVSGENHAFDIAEFSWPETCKMIVLQNEMAPGLVHEIAQMARGRGAHVMWNAAPAEGLTANELADVDTLIVNRVEAAQILGVETGDLDVAAALPALRQQAPQADIILTLGQDGVAFCSSEGEFTHQAATPVKARSTHGAGDVFVGTYAAESLKGQSQAAAVATAQKAAALHIS